MGDGERDRTEREAERLVVATLYLMSGYARTRCPRLACMVARHLEVLARHPGAGGLLREMAARLAGPWNPRLTR